MIILPVLMYCMYFLDGNFFETFSFLRLSFGQLSFTEGVILFRKLSILDFFFLEILFPFGRFERLIISRGLI